MDVKALNIHKRWDVDVALNIPRHSDVKLNELPKKILMLLPLLLLLLRLYVLYHVLTREPSCNARSKMKLQERSTSRTHQRGTIE